MRFPVLLLCLLLPASVWATTYHVATTGQDTHTCEQATSPATARRTINSGIGCLAPGDTLEIGAGTYPEWLITSLDGTTAVHPRYTDVQPGTHVIPSGLSAQQPTRLVGARTGATVLSPLTKNPETSTILGFIGAHGRFLTFERLHFRKAGPLEERTQGQGVYLADAQDVTLAGGSVYRGGVYSSAGSVRLTIRGMDIGFSGEGCDFLEGDPYSKYEPCPHGLYLCGHEHVIERNTVHDNAHTGIQVSCEQTNSSATIHGNVVRNHPGPGIGLKGTGSITSNVLEGNGTGIRPNGTIVTANNTIVDYYHHNAWVPDPWGILYEGDATIVNNLMYKQKSAFNILAERTFTVPIAPDWVHHQMCDMAGNPGCTLIQPEGGVFTDLAGQDYTLKAGSPARGAGVAHPAAVVDARGRPYPTPPDLGAYAASGGTPEVPPQPPAGATRVTCEGLLGSSAGALVLLCTPAPSR